MLMNWTRMTCALGLLLSLLLASTVPAAAQASHPWAGFGPGSWVEITSVTVSTAAGNEQASTVRTKITLLQKTADKVTLENESTINGQTMKNTFDLPLQGYSDALPEGMTVLRTGSETLAIAGRLVTCATMEASMNAGGTTFLFKRWTSGQVPGSMVKSVTSSQGSQATAEVVDFKTY
jgi:hypothetical protein